MELNCKVIELLPVQSGTSSKGSWEKHQFVVSWMEGQYEQKLCLEVMGADKWEKMKNAAVVGNEVIVKFGVSSREYQSKWYTTCTCWYCASVNPTNSQRSEQSVSTQSQNTPQQSNDDSQLPF